MTEVNNDGGTTQPTGDTAPSTDEGSTAQPTDSIAEALATAEPQDKGKEAKETKGVSSLPKADGEPGSQEKKPEEEIKERNKDDESDKELKGAPEEYGEFDLNAGKEIGYQISAEHGEAFSKFGKDNNLTQKQMQNVIEFDIARQKETLEANKKLIDDYKQEGLQEGLKIHGDKYHVMHAKNMVTYDKFFSIPLRGEEGKTLKDALNDIGISSQPEFFELLNRMTAAISEDVTIPGASGGSDPRKRTLEDAFK
jgi:hypothetical protein